MSAKKVYEVKEVERVVREQKRVVTGVELTLTPEQAITLRTILQYVGGSPRESIRGHAEEVDGALDEAGVPYIDRWVGGFKPSGLMSDERTQGIYFEDASNGLMRVAVEKLK